MRSLIMPSLWLVTGFAIPTILFAPSPEAIAHQQMSSEDVQMVSHLEPNDAPVAGQPSSTWFHLRHPSGEAVSLSDCNCQLTVYDEQNQAIAQPQLAETGSAEHGSQISTMITFPRAGTYHLMLTGQSKTASFEPFEFRIPVTVRP